MTEYFGSPVQSALQKRLFEAHSDIVASPYLSNGGRLLNILDPDALGWDQVRAIAERDLFVGLTAVPLQETLEKLRDVFGADIEHPYWHVFLGDATEVLQSCQKIAASYTLPKGWSTETVSVPSDSVINAMQELNAETGVMPTPTYYLRSELVPSLTTCIWTETGTLAACATASMRYHPKSRFANTLFAGSVSVALQLRKKGLGTLTNAILLRDSQKMFGWTRVLEQAQEENLPSCGMIRKCGLIQDPDLVTIVVNLSGGYITR